MNQEMTASVEAEYLVLACLLTHQHLLLEVDLQPGVFSVESNREVYGAIMALTASDAAVDAVVVAEYLQRETGKDWLAIVVRIAAMGAYPSMFGGYCKIVRQAGVRREAAGIARRLLDAGDSETAIDLAISELMALSVGRKNHDHTIKQAMKAAVDEIEQAFEGDGLAGVATGIADLDKSLGGLHGSDLIVIGARPSVGKTALALNMADKSPEGCGIVSTEQGMAQVAMRFMSMRAKVSAHKIRQGALNEDEFVRIGHAVGHYNDKNIFINDAPGISYLDVISQARKWKFNHGIKILFIDYLQRIKHPETRKPRHEQVAEMVQAFKELARSLEIPVVVLSQIVREVDSRPDKRPGMGDLANSSEIEREADQIITMYRDEVYNPDTQDKGMAELIVCKNRHGNVGMIPVAWTGEFMRFSDLDDRYEPEYSGR